MIVSFTRAISSRIRFAGIEIEQLRLLVKSQSKSQIVFMGDSHAWYLANCVPATPKSHVFLNEQGELVIWLGPRLMYSVGAKGFNFGALQALALLIAKKKNFSYLVVCLGEIDCRMYSSKLENSSDLVKLVNRYYEHLLRTSETYGFREVLVITPIPPSDLGAVNESFPRRSSLETRVSTTSILTQNLIEFSEKFGFKTINSQALLGLASSSTIIGELNGAYSLDGCHVNKDGAELIRMHINSILRNP
jgi:lysophospholipase L1-like esterase